MNVDMKRFRELVANPFVMSAKSGRVMKEDGPEILELIEAAVGMVEMNARFLDPGFETHFQKAVEPFMEKELKL